MVFWLKKTEGSKSLNKRRALTHCLAPIKVLGLVYFRRREKRDTKNCGHKYRFFCLVPRYKNVFERSINVGPLPAQEVKNCEIV